MTLVRGVAAVGDVGLSRPLPALESASRTPLSPRQLSRLPLLVLWMALAIAGVGAVAYWDERQEARAALDEMADDQRWLAESLARAFGVHLASLSPEVRPTSLQRVLAPLHAFERRNDTVVLVRVPGEMQARTSSGSLVTFAPLSNAPAGRPTTVRLSRIEAVALGLPPRMAVAGLAEVDAPASGTWRIAVVATAQAEREREERAHVRLLWSVTLAVVLILAFGGAALRRRTRELRLQHELELQAVANQRDESLRRADKIATLGTLAMGIAHEVSTPLTVIMARAEQLVSKADVDPRTRRAGEAIRVEGQRINEVVRGFLSLVRGDKPRLEYKEPANLARSAIELVSHRFTKANVRLTTHLDAAAPSVACDGRLFEQVLVNLLLNACDACSAGGSVDFTVAVDEDYVAFVITDTGSGIAADMQRAAELFFTTKADGTGLGLAIASEIVKHHRGTLVIQARSDTAGTRAVVELPR